MNQATKKVLYLITKATWGGAQRYVYDLATHLPSEQYVASVAYGEVGRLQKMLEEKNIATHSLSALGRDVALFSDIASLFQIMTLLRKLRPSVLHVNSSKAAALGALAGRLCGVPKIIFTVHGWPFKEDRNAIAKMLIHFISWFTAILSHTTIVVSKEDEDIGKRMYLVGKKVTYIPLGIESPVFLSRDEAATSLSITTNAPRVVTIAELTKNKGIAYAIDAIAELKKQNNDCGYFIIGDGELRSELQQQIDKLEVSERVHFLGFLENAATYLRAFDVFLLPSIKEGTPYVLLEAAAANLPLIVTDVIDSTFADQYPAVKFIAPRNSAAIVDAIKQTKIEPKDATAIAQNMLENMINLTTVMYS